MTIPSPEKCTLASKVKRVVTKLAPSEFVWREIFQIIKLTLKGNKQKSGFKALSLFRRLF